MCRLTVRGQAVREIGNGTSVARYALDDHSQSLGSVGPQWNAAAISGEYLSAASFLGVAGLIAKYGADALWYPVGPPTRPRRTPT